MDNLPKKLTPPTMDDSVVICNNRTYLVKDLELKNDAGIVIFTHSQTWLHPGQQSRGHSHVDQDELYHFLQGKGMMILDTEVRFVTADSFVAVPKGVFHKVVNTGEATDLIFECTVQGPIQRPPFKK